MSDNREIFRDTVERILADTLTQADIEAAEQRILPADLFGALEENGITTMLAAEDKGGIGASLSEAMTILRATGSAAAPGPILETLLGQSLLAQAGLTLPNGPITLAFTDSDIPPGETCWATPPAFHDVPWGDLVDCFVTVARDGDGDGARIAVSDPKDWSVTAGTDAAGEPRDRLEGLDIPVIVRDLPATGYETLLRTASLLRAGQILGAIEWTFGRSVDYAMERKQFGREIGKFQVIQQMLAELAGHTLASSAITEAAAEGFGATLAAAARARLGEASDAAITIGHQVHGAMGFSREYGLNYRTRRLMAWRDDYGSTLFWQRSLGGSFTGLGRDGFWPGVADAGLSSVG